MFVGHAVVVPDVVELSFLMYFAFSYFLTFYYYFSISETRCFFRIMTNSPFWGIALVPFIVVATVLCSSERYFFPMPRKWDASVTFVFEVQERFGPLFLSAILERASSLLFPRWDVKTKRPEPINLDWPLF